jgi:hypothetical protein
MFARICLGFWHILPQNPSELAMIEKGMNPKEFANRPALKT